MSLQRAIDEITEIGLGFGLDPYPMRYDICPASMIQTFASYGMPTRYTHWSFGKAYHRLRLNEQVGLGKIYELVINHNPCHAFLLDSNSLLQNKLIIAHVLAHSDFFKNNHYFSNTNRQMIETMALAAQRLHAYEEKYGIQEVEHLVDAAHVLQMHRTILPFISSNHAKLPLWKADVLQIVQEEMDYFWPQMETKICNEGWATFWHRKIMRELPLTEEEAVAYASLHASVIQPARYATNPYQLGLSIFESIEEKRGIPGIFQARTEESDLSLLRNELTPEIIANLQMKLVVKQNHSFKTVEADWKHIREQLVHGKVNNGFPMLRPEIGLHHTLVLHHHYEEIELDLKELELTLPLVYRLWENPVQIRTMLEGKPATFTYTGLGIQRKFG